MQHTTLKLHFSGIGKAVHNTQSTHFGTNMLPGALTEAFSPWPERVKAGPGVAMHQNEVARSAKKGKPPNPILSFKNVHPEVRETLSVIPRTK